MNDVGTASPRELLQASSSRDIQEVADRNAFDGHPRGGQIFHLRTGDRSDNPDIDPELVVRQSEREGASSGSLPAGLESRGEQED
jgi:hypothetical protein